MTVRLRRIGDILELRRRAVEVRVDAAYREIGVRSFGNGLFIKPAVTGADLGNKRVFAIEPGDLVVSNVFGWEGAVAVATSAHTDMIGSHRFMTWTPKTADVDVRYLQQYFVSDAGLVDLRAASPGSAGRNKTLSIKNFESIEVPLPEASEQRRIAAHLASIQTDGRQMAASRRNPWNAIESVLIGLQWNVPLRSLLHEDFDEIELQSDATYRQIDVFGGGRGVIDRGTFVGSSTKYTKMLRVRGGQVVMSRLKAFEGAVAVVPARHDGALVSKEFPTFSLAADADPQFVRAILRSSLFEAGMRSKSIGLGARRERVDASRFLSIAVPVPPPDVQRAIGAAACLAGRTRALQLRSEQLGSALLPAARNEVFSSLR